ncbi:unnamed protein product [Cuscuta campestris]|uniref:Uncharacterized protein n=1 Tax=Cuscuta campestris TaxID=132261 RepID=A0A484NB99_9ASTE|nr:unnamed protein product [Cuscuta campestris]
MQNIWSHSLNKAICQLDHERQGVTEPGALFSMFGPHRDAIKVENLRAANHLSPCLVWFFSLLLLIIIRNGDYFVGSTTWLLSRISV